MVEVDVRGLSCPLPVMHTEQALQEGRDEITVLADSGTAKANVVHLLEDEGFSVAVEETGGGYRIKATR